jgi:hypothetical protein
MIARSFVIVGFVAASVQPAVGQGSDADARRRAAEQSAARYRFVDQADTAWTAKLLVKKPAIASARKH